MSMIDAHCHLQDDRLNGRFPEIIACAKKAGVLHVVCCGTSQRDWQRVRTLSEQYPDLIVPSFGLHPWFIRDRSAGWLNELESLVRDTPAAVGEIGLDYALEDFDPAEQIAVFAAQVELAQRYHRPVSIHCRKAWDALTEVLERSGPLLYGGIIHSYSGTADMVPHLSALGLSFSFSGSITRPGNKKGRKSLCAVPLDRLLVETDSPDMAPAGVVGLTEPAHLGRVIKSIAVQLNKPEDEIAEITAGNARAIFGRVGSGENASVSFP